MSFSSQNLPPLPLPLVVWGCSFGGAVGLRAQQGVQFASAHPLRSRLLAEPGCWLESRGLDGPDQKMQRRTWLDSAQCPCLTSCSFSVPRGKVELSCPQNWISFSHSSQCCIPVLPPGGNGTWCFTWLALCRIPFFLKTKDFDRPTGKATGWKARGYPPPLLVPFLSLFALPASLRVRLRFCQDPVSLPWWKHLCNPCSPWLHPGSPLLFQPLSDLEETPPHSDRCPELTRWHNLEVRGSSCRRDLLEPKRERRPRDPPCYGPFRGSVVCYALPELSHVTKKPAVLYHEAVTNSLASTHFPPSLPCFSFSLIFTTLPLHLPEKH